MEFFLVVSLTALWGVVLVNLLLTLRVVRWMRGLEDMQGDGGEVPELSSGMPAPDFRAKTLSNEPVSLASYAGRAVVFVFVSPHCGVCRHEVPKLVRLGKRAREREGIELILVSDARVDETRNWVNTIRVEDKVLVDNLPVLVAPRANSDLFTKYNPRGLTPYFCYVDKEGIVRVNDPLGQSEWFKLKRSWEDPASIPFSQSPERYR
jgi:thiol-disulfide isomerase/thioredoxin